MKKDPKAFSIDHVTKHGKHFVLPLVNYSSHLFVSVMATHKESKVTAFI